MTGLNLLSKKIDSVNKRGLSTSQRRKILVRGGILFFTVYAIATLAPYYILFIRTFVGTKESA